MYAFELLGILAQSSIPFIHKSLHLDLFKVSEELTVQTPTLEGLLGDKLAAFAPNTIGVPYGAGKSMEIIKQLFDIG